MPDGYITFPDMLKANQVDVKLAKKLLKRFSAQIGEIGNYRMVMPDGRIGKMVPGFSPEQQQLFAEVLIRQREETEAGRRDYSNVQSTVPDGYVNRFELSKELGVANSTVQQHYEKIRDKIGEPEVFINKIGVRTKYFSPEQAKAIIASVKSSHRLGKGGRPRIK